MRTERSEITLGDLVLEIARSSDDGMIRKFTPALKAGLLRPELVVFMANHCHATDEEYPDVMAGLRDALQKEPLREDVVRLRGGEEPSMILRMSEAELHAFCARKRAGLNGYIEPERRSA